MRRFELGVVVATPGALQALGSAELAGELLGRHASGDWGDLCESDKRANDQALEYGGRIFSAYDLPGGGKVWVITEAAGDDGHRASTCVLLPSEY